MFFYVRRFQDYLKDTKACLTNDFSRYKRALTSVRQDLPDADNLAQARQRTLPYRIEQCDASYFTSSSMIVVAGAYMFPRFWNLEMSTGQCIRRLLHQNRAILVCWQSPHVAFTLLLPSETVKERLSELITFVVAS